MITTPYTYSLIVYTFPKRSDVAQQIYKPQENHKQVLRVITYIVKITTIMWWMYMHR